MCLQQKYESITVSGGSHKFRPDPQTKPASEKPAVPLNLGWIAYLSTGRLSYPLSGGSDNKESTCSAGDWVRSLGREDPPEKGKATHSNSCLENSMDKEPGELQSIELRRVRHNRATNTTHNSQMNLKILVFRMNYVYFQ